MPKRRRYPSFIEKMFRRMFERMEKSFRRGFRPLWEEEEFEDQFRDPFEEMVDRFEKETPEEFEEFVREEETPLGKERRYGPFVYGFSYTQKPGEEPEFREFGNVRPGKMGEIEPKPEGEREPLAEVTDLGDRYEATVEMPGVEKDEIDLTATENSLKIKTTGDRKYTKEISFDEPLDTDKVDANFRLGILNLEIEKKGTEEEGRSISVK